MSADSSQTFAISQATVRYAALIVSQRDAPMRRRRVTFERAIQELPFSFKVWYQYTSAISRHAIKQPPSSHWRAAATAVYERALAYLPSMPLLWSEYIDLLAKLNAVTAVRRVVDRALIALPVTLHSQWVWPLALRCVINDERQPQRRALALYRRLIKFDPTKREEFIAFTERRNVFGAAAETLLDCLNDSAF